MSILTGSKVMLAGMGRPNRTDLLAGLTASAVVLPKAMAYATVAGLPVAVGLYTAFIPMLIYALLGSSRVLSVSSTSTLAILAGTELGLVVPSGDPLQLLVATATLTALVGVILLLASVLRLGFVANFISTPVLTGFKCGIGLVIVLDQLPKLLGVHITKQGFFPDLWHLGLQSHGLSTVGHIPQGFPAVTLPGLTLVGELLPGALGIALMSFTETIAAGRAFTRQSEAAPDANRELIATGVGNVLGSLLGSMPAGAALPRLPWYAPLADRVSLPRW